LHRGNGILKIDTNIYGSNVELV